MLDLEVTPELAREGVARDLVRSVQQVRRDAGLAVGDRIVLTARRGRPRGRTPSQEHGSMLARETLALDVRGQRSRSAGCTRQAGPR